MGFTNFREDNLGVRLPDSSFSIQLILALTGVSFITCIIVSIYRLAFHPLAKIPGPKIAAITKAWHVYQLASGNHVYVMRELHEKYGPVVRTQPNELSFASSRAWDDIYGFRHGKDEITKDTPMYHNPVAIENIVTAPREKHSLYRRLLSRGFSDAALREQEAMIQRMLSLLMSRLHEKASKGESVNMVSWYNFFTFDVIGDLVFGETFGCLDESTYHPWISLIFFQMKFLTIVTAISNYPWLVNVCLRLIPKSIKKQAEAHDEMTLEKLKRRMERNIDRADFLSNMLNPKHNISERALLGNSSALIIAGSETTATLLSGATYFLGRNETVRNKLVEEVRSSFSSPEEITFASVSRLTYLLAVLNESLRLYPPVPSTLTRRVPTEGAIIDNFFVPKGTYVGVNILSSQTTSANFKNPERFSPERWLGDPEYIDDDLSAVKPFSHGPRNCIGKNLAYMEMRLVLARMVYEFDITLEDSVPRNWSYAKVFTLRSKEPLQVRLVPVVRHA